MIVAGLIYLLSSTISSSYGNRLEQQSAAETNGSSGKIKLAIMQIVAGIIALLSIDLVSGGNPAWPALGLVLCFFGEIFPRFTIGKSQKIGLIFWGGLFYLYPNTALSAVGIAIPVWLFRRDWGLSLVVFSGAVSVLFRYDQTSPWFLAAAVIVALLTWGKYWCRLKDKC